MSNKLIAASCVSVLLVLSANSQGTFQNLDFESAKIVIENNSQDTVSTINAIPGWKAFWNSAQLSSVPYNMWTAIPVIGLYGSNSLVIGGTFSVLLGRNGSISQIGVLPSDVRSLLFTASMNSPSPIVSLDGQTLLVTAISSSSTQIRYAADLSASAGQIVSLKFAGNGTTTMIDDIGFSSEPVPEPSAKALALLACGLLVSGLSAKRHRSHGNRS